MEPINQSNSLNSFNPYSVYCEQLKSYYENHISELKIKHSEEKGFLSCKINILENENAEFKSAISVCNTKIIELNNTIEKLRSEKEFDTLLYESRFKMQQKLIDSSKDEDFTKNIDKDTSKDKHLDKDITADINSSYDWYDKMKHERNAYNEDIDYKKRKYDDMKYRKYDDDDDMKYRKYGDDAKHSDYNDVKQREYGIYKKEKSGKKINTSGNYRILCYYGKNCDKKDCVYGHTLEELSICPYGLTCNRSCRFMFHSIENKRKFIETNVSCVQKLCKEFNIHGKCSSKLCEHIHYNKTFQEL